MLLPEGLLPGAYTPFTDDNKLDDKVLAQHLQGVVAGSGGLHGPAGHSEFASLTFDEWKVWIDVMVDVAHNARIPAWAFFGAESYEKTLPYARYALKAGADGFWVIAPYFNLYSQEAAYNYYRDFANEFAETPIIFYPSRQTGNYFQPATIARIAELPNIVGMKLSSDDTLEHVGKVIMMTRDNPTFRSVAAALNPLYPLLTHANIKACCSPFSPFVHEWSLSLWNAYLARDWPTLEKWRAKIVKISGVVNVAGDRHEGARAGHKAALALLGRPVGLPRRPAIPATEEHIARIRKVFQEEGLL